MPAIHKTLIGLGCMAAIPVAAWFAIEFGGKRETFAIPSNDASCVFHCTQKQRWLRTGKVGPWIFTDSEPQWTAVEAHFEYQNRIYPIPRSLVRKFARPRSISIVVTESTATAVKIFIRGGGGASADVLTLDYANGQLQRAKAQYYNEDITVPIYP